MVKKGPIFVWTFLGRVLKSSKCTVQRNFILQIINYHLVDYHMNITISHHCSCGPSFD